MVEQRDKARAQKIARGVAAGIDQKQEEEQEIGVVETLAVDFGREQLGREVVGGPRALFGDDAARIFEHLHHRADLRARLHRLPGALCRISVSL